MSTNQQSRLHEENVVHDVLKRLKFTREMEILREICDSSSMATIPVSINHKCGRVTRSINKVTILSLAVSLLNAAQTVSVILFTSYVGQVDNLLRNVERENTSNRAVLKRST